MNKYVVTLVIAAGVPAAQATSFDCSNAVTHAQKLICRDATISSLDDTVMSTYEQADDYLRRLPLLVATEQDGFTNAHRAWLGERDRCASTHCLADSYRRRLDILNGDLVRYRSIYFYY